ncbi:MAG TPA: hypothetical protein P5511_07075 [Candidatus Goldiibacteriota bacterium]|nr:hypothetical protein [Candidatus Goldiibacteriota bacterium]
MRINSRTTAVSETDGLFEAMTGEGIANVSFDDEIPRFFAFISEEPELIKRGTKNDLH